MLQIQVIYKAFEKACEKANLLVKKLNLKALNLSVAVVFEEKIYYGDNLIETALIPVTAKVKLIFYYPN